MKEHAYGVRIIQGLRHISWIFLMTFLLTGCGSYYTVSADSLRDDKAAAHINAYCLMPADESISEDDLFFREVVRMIAPAFMARGYKITADRAEAKGIAYLSYWQEEPFVTMNTYTTYRTEPVVVWDGDRERIEYVTVEQPEIATNVIHTAILRIEAFENSKKAKPLWSTMLRCSGGTEDFRTLLNQMTPVLPQVLGTHTLGMRKFEVFAKDNGSIEITEY